MIATRPPILFLIELFCFYEPLLEEETLLEEEDEDLVTPLLLETDLLGVETERVVRVLVGL